LTIEDEFELFDDGKDEGRIGFVGNEDDDTIGGFDRMKTLRLDCGNGLCERDFFETRRLTRDRLSERSDSSFIVDSDSIVVGEPFSTIVLK
jgi:hypothetical protein